MLAICANSHPIEENEIFEMANNSIDEENTIDSSIPTDYIDLSQYGAALYGQPDIDGTGKAVAEYTTESNTNPEELGSYVEGDILIPQQMGRNGLRAATSRWPNGIIPFEIRGNFNAREMALIEQAITEFHSKTCIKFVPRMAQTDYISIVSGSSGCWSSVGRIGGKQEVNLQAPGCLTKPGTPMHELMHAVGFLHEQNRNERDSYVTILFENIQPSAVSNFDKASADKTTGFGVPYDYGSVMHYSSNAFSTNRNPTIVPKRQGVKLGQRDGFSPMDVQKLNAMYNCNIGSNSVGASGGRPSGTNSNNGQQGPDANIINSFLGGLISGLGLAEESSTEKSQELRE
ncbi:zinc metalloproteinase nas-4 isoform X2 [Episyrphus balteatus]|uniref:zinc metalloproteinase nas-4 isoform X2 n=1 Tax=Episyrphus balteatus TaxID=286459 RepID=UPI0024853AAB|nr:zinc metalloproteinase nas-4 isoform X2 [Episyrphus balteatus]